MSDSPKFDVNDYGKWFGRGFVLFFVTAVVFKYFPALLFELVFDKVHWFWLDCLWFVSICAVGPLVVWDAVRSEQTRRNILFDASVVKHKCLHIFGVSLVVLPFMVGFSYMMHQVPFLRSAEVFKPDDFMPLVGMILLIVTYPILYGSREVLVDKMLREQKAGED